MTYKNMDLVVAHNNFSCYEANIFKFLKLLLKAKKKKSIKIHDLAEDRHKSVVE
jgi:NAD/NADP transhydrogenase alpha subunit